MKLSVRGTALALWNCFFAVIASTLTAADWQPAKVPLMTRWGRAVTPDKAPQLLAHHDREVEIYLNGVFAAKLTGYTLEYQEFEIRPEARATLKPGKNVLAVHCHREGKGGYIDVGVVDPQQEMAYPQLRRPFQAVDVGLKRPTYGATLSSSPTDP